MNIAGSIYRFASRFIDLETNIGEYDRWRNTGSRTGGAGWRPGPLYPGYPSFGTDPIPVEPKKKDKKPPTGLDLRM